MTKSETRALVERFFDGVSAGAVPDDILTPDMTFWSVSGGDADKARFQGGIGLLAQVANRTIRYDIVSLTAEDDRVAAEIRSTGTLINGEAMQNNHVFLFRLRDGKIASASEYMNQLVVRDQIAPLMQQAMAKAQR